MLCLWPGPPWFNQWFPLTLACSGRLAKSTLSLFCHSDWFDFVFSLRWVVLGIYYDNQTFDVFFFFCIKNYIGTQGDFVYSEGPLSPLVEYTADRSKAVFPMLFLFCVAL